MLRGIKVHSKATVKGLKNLEKSVVAVNEHAIEEYIDRCDKGEIPLYMGVKDTTIISKDVLKKLRNSGFVFHTIDTKSSGGRSVDTALINPLIGNSMTGSSSGSAINVLLGINDLAVATDSDGGMLGASIATHQYSFLGAKLGVSTGEDRTNVQESVGFIAKNIYILNKAITPFINRDEMIKDIKITIINDLNEKNEDIVDSKYEFICNMLDKLGFKEVDVKYMDLSLDREDLLGEFKELEKDKKVFISYEHNIDIYGTGDSIIGMFGQEGQRIQKKGNKGVIRVLNMLNTNVITVPDNELSSAFVLFSFKNDTLDEMLKLSEYIDSNSKKNNVFERYFKEGFERNNMSRIFEI